MDGIRKWGKTCRNYGYTNNGACESVTRMLPRCIACLGKDTLIGFLLITFTWINTFSYPLYMKFALTGYIVSMAMILYVHVIGAIALLPRRDYFAMIIEIASMARILYVHVI